MTVIRTKVAIVGAGPAGLLLGHRLAASGIEFVIIEARSREHVLSRIRAGVLEQGSVDVLSSLGLGENLKAHGLVHHGLNLQFEGQRHRVNLKGLVGRTVTVYGQQRVVSDLMEAHDSAGSALYFEAENVLPSEVETSKPKVDFVHKRTSYSVEADFIVGADGFHGICRSIIPASHLTSFEHDYPFAWLGILANVPPSIDEVIYALHPDGLAMHSMRSPEVSRLYIQVPPDENVANWSDSRIWDALQARLGLAGWTLREGEITQKSITPMRSFVASTLNYGNLFLAGDAGHIVPPTGAKGLNSAIADVAMLGAAFASAYEGNRTPLTTYSDRALSRQWKAQYFSRWMTEMLHTSGGGAEGEYRYRSQVGQLEYVTGSHAALEGLAEQYTGLPIEGL
jgi:p-hydroxybenzoate 3-monooxygenase